jgi:hypothetical protein
VSLIVRPPGGVVEKLYKRIDGALRYHEAWEHAGTITEHWGLVGERGTVKEHPAPKVGKVKALKKLLQPAIDQGFAPIDEDDMPAVLVEYVVDGFGSRNDIEKRHELEEHLNELLGWTGLGHCDGGSIGSGTMEACCFVVDADIAIRVLEAELRSTKFGDFARVYEEER